MKAALLALIAVMSFSAYAQTGHQGINKHENGSQASPIMLSCDCDKNKSPDLNNLNNNS